MRVVVVTGLSGAGKSTALRALEDVSFFCVDNLPLPMVPEFVDVLSGKGIENVALSVDARQEFFLSEYRGQVGKLRAKGHRVEVLFLEADDEVLIRRYSATRRRHPLAGDDLIDGIRKDRQVLSELREDGAIVNTGRLNVHQLKGIIQERYGRLEGHLATTLVSFGFKHGVPPEADLVFDVRFLPNPYFDERLSGSHGRDPQVAEFVLETDEGRAALAKVLDYIEFSLPRFEREGKRYLTVAIGCTGGRHRSVAMVEELARRLSDDWDVLIRHRDLNEDG